MLYKKLNKIRYYNSFVRLKFTEIYSKNHWHRSFQNTKQMYLSRKLNFTGPAHGANCPRGKVPAFPETRPTLPPSYLQFVWCSNTYWSFCMHYGGWDQFQPFFRLTDYYIRKLFSNSIFCSLYILWMLINPIPIESQWNLNFVTK